MRGGDVGDAEFRPARQPAGERVAAHASETGQPGSTFAHALMEVAPGPGDFTAVSRQSRRTCPSCRGGLERLRDGSCAGSGAHAACDGGLISRRTILPVGPFGSESSNHTSRGYLYAASLALTKL